MLEPLTATIAPTALDGLPAEALVPVLVGLVVIGLAAWLLGRKLARPGCAVTGLAAGALTGLVGAIIFQADPTVTLVALIGGALVGAVFAWLAFRFWMALIGAAVLGLALPTAALAWQGLQPAADPGADLQIQIDQAEPTEDTPPATQDLMLDFSGDQAEPGTEGLSADELLQSLREKLPDREELEQMTADDLLARLGVESIGELDLGQLLQRLPNVFENLPRDQIILAVRQQLSTALPGDYNPSPPADGDAPQQRRELGDYARIAWTWLGEEFGALWSGWSGMTRTLLTGLGLVGVVIGLTLGLVAPYLTAGVTTSLIGAAVWLPAARGLLAELAPASVAEVPTVDSPAGVAAVVVVALIGLGLQTLIAGRRKPDN